MNNEYLERFLLKYYEKHLEMQFEDMDVVNSAFLYINSFVNNMDSITLAIDGNSGAGKSSFADIMKSIYDCNIFHMDHFFLSTELKTEERLGEVGGNVDYERFYKDVISFLHSGKEFEYKAFNCKNQKLEKTILVEPKKINIIEGVYSMHPTLIEHYDLKIFLEIDSTRQSQRILKRNGEQMHKKFMDLWIPLENKYFEELKIKEKCDLVINV